MNDCIAERGFLYESAPFPSCHASTLVEVPDGILAAYFGGTHERHPDVCIYTSRLVDGQWGEPVEVADGIQPDGSRLPTWNPVLFCPKNGPLMLFYKVGPSPSTWWGMLKTSDDDGRTWSEAKRLPDGILGPIKNKPVQLDDGTIISPTSIEGKEIGWRVYFEISTNGGQTWHATPYVDQDPDVKAIQPSILIHPNNVLQAIGRTQKNQRLFTTWSHDGGRTWSKLELTDLPNCNSGTDAVTLADGRHLLVYNHSDTEKVRYPLNVAISDNGTAWHAVAVLEHEPTGQYSYPCVIQARDGSVHIAYTWKRLKIGYVRLSAPSTGSAQRIEGGNWPIFGSLEEKCSVR